jgi:hypothetical protein
MSNQPELRVDDEARERVVWQLREHFAAGRLNAEELEERIGTAYSARTEGELRKVLEDLPVLPAIAGAEQRAELATRRSALTRALAQQTGAALAPFVICTLVWAFSDPGGDFWPAWVLIVALVPLVRNLWHLYGPAPELDRVEAHLAEQRQRQRGLPPPPSLP